MCEIESLWSVKERVKEFSFFLEFCCFFLSS
jgi:hypothetical protein